MRDSGTKLNGIQMQARTHIDYVNEYATKIWSRMCANAFRLNIDDPTTLDH